MGNGPLNPMGVIGAKTRWGEVTGRSWHGRVEFPAGENADMVTPEREDVEMCQIDCSILSELIMKFQVQVVQTTVYDNYYRDYFHCSCYVNGKKISNFVPYHEEKKYGK